MNLVIYAMVLPPRILGSSEHVHTDESLGFLGSSDTFTLMIVARVLGSAEHVHTDSCC